MGKMGLAAELDGTFYRCSGRTLEPVVDLSDVKGVQRVVSDFEGAAISRTVTVEAPYKYAEVMVRKQLQETGEFDEPVTLLSHWKKRRGKNATDIFYTALPTRLFYRFLDEVKNHEDCILLFPLYAVLYSVLRKARLSNPSAVVFQHGRVADILLGDRKRVYYANRRVAFDDSPEQISSLWQMVASEITSAEGEHHISVETITIVTWADSRIESEWPAELEEKVRFFDEESLFFEGEERKISFLKALAGVPAKMSVNRPPEKLSFYCTRILPVVEVSVIIIALGLFGAHFWYGTKSRSIEETLKERDAAIAGLKGTKLPETVPYEKSFAFVSELARYRAVPGFKTVVNDVSEALFDGGVVEVLKAEYDKGNLKLEILGKGNVPFNKAFKGYQGFCSAMARRGYLLVNKNFSTSINTSQFVVTFERRAR